MKSILISGGDIQVYNWKKEVEQSIEGRSIRNALQIDQEWIYVLCDESYKWDNRSQSYSNVGIPSESGLYVYDYSRLVQHGQVEVYKIRSASVGINTNIDYSDYMQRISFLSDYEDIEIVPIPHRNQINFFGMRPKDDYMIWHQDPKKGTFTAVDENGLLIQWSTVTGKICENNENGVNVKQVIPKVFDFSGYEVF